MCGIIGYVGNRDVIPVLINGLKRLEYRGYDSAGIALFNNGIKVFKCSGKIRKLEQILPLNAVKADTGIGHTRWATHGEPSDINAHPHQSMNGYFTLVHNGIIENYSRLKKRLEDRGYIFKSDTDTEVLVNLIEYIYMKGNVSAVTAVRLALRKVVGAYGLAILCSNEPGKIIAARNSSPLVIGIGQNEYFVASDATPIVAFTKRVIYLDDHRLAVMSKDGMETADL